MDERVEFFYDFVDPVSYLTGRELEAASRHAGIEVFWTPLELLAPPAPLRTLADSPFALRWTESNAVDPTTVQDWRPPRLVPWTRKAHELVLHAAGHDCDAAARTLLFSAYFERGLDIGRVDVLVGLAAELQLDATETKAVLDVDRYSADVAAHRTRAETLLIAGPGVLVASGSRLEGFHNRADIRTFLLS
jgi:predicted DsbA family dithiol-disulfide isomerase